MDSFCDSNGEGDNLPGNPSTKKVCFKYSESNPDVEMVVDLTSAPTLSWKDLVLGKGPIESKGMNEVGFANGEFSLLEGDVKKSVVNGIPVIELSDRVHKLLVKDMSTSVVLKLLGRNIDFAALQNKVYGLWRLSQPFQLMDIENGYFLAKRILILVLFWPGLDFQGSLAISTKRRFYENLGERLGSSNIEYESLPVVCFLCGRYGHCLHGLIAVDSPRKTIPMTRTSHAVTGTTTGTGEFGPWMLVEKKTRHNPCEDRKIGKSKVGRNFRD
ncbi:hypothetical protein CXB51_033735 [Gossypium anomalum]|uniref:Uncharacterized protein n=1 Tax=Gossypium anomalum TaxID=47600 RepID=A0A8J5XZM0_9ROSI|nr:hypothetical protein CXB51_033735 [Gossypium anomalum]